MRGETKKSRVINYKCDSFVSFNFAGTIFVYGLIAVSMAIFLKTDYDALVFSDTVLEFVYFICFQIKV